MALSKSEILEKLGPLKALAGHWVGDKGDDTAPSDTRGTEKNLYREEMKFEPFGPVNNHEQELFGLKYSTVAYRLGEEDSFHEETGYWLWDEKEQQVMRCFIVPRGITVLAGGTVRSGTKSFEISADLGSKTYGICSNLFLDREFQTVKYILKIEILGDGHFSYEEDTQLLLKGRKDVFHHIDKNVMKRVSL